MAAGDILSVAINADGWTADVKVAGVSTGGTYAFGLGANNDPLTGTPKVVFTITSLGYDESKAVVARTRTVYGVKALRKAYPDQATNNETVDGSDVIVKIILSDYVYAKDIAGAGLVANTSSGTAPVVSILSGFYTQGGTPNNASGAGFAVTNNSTADYPKVVANHSWPGNQRVTGDFKLRCVAFHGTSVFNGATQAGGGKGNIACVEFTATDESANTATTLVTSPSIDSTLPDPVPVIEWVGTMAVSSLTQGHLLTCNFKAYPLVGDTAAILDTSSGTAQPTPLYGPITNVCDKSGTYGRTIAAVAADGTSSGVAVNVADYASLALAEAAALANPCDTIARAYQKIVAFNNTTHSRNDGGAGEIILAAGTYAWTGAGSTFGNKPECWAIIRPASGVARADAIVSGQSTSTDLRDMVKFEGVTVGGTAAFMFIDIDSLWFDGCVMSATGSAVVNNGCKAQYWTHNVMSGFVQGIYPATLWTSAPALVRGNDLNGFTKAIITYTVLGNSKTSVDVGTISLFNKDRGTAGQQGFPNAVNAIIAFNKILGYNDANPLINWAMVNANTHGAAIVQNVFENYDNGVAALGDIASDAVAAPANNFILWNNVFAGGRVLHAYNDTGSTSLEKKFWSEKNNLYDYYAIKTDTFTTANANRTGNWPEVFGVNASGNGVSSITGFTDSNDFIKEFTGLKTIANDTQQANDYFKYTDDKAYKGGADTTGLGDYSLTEDSPVLGLQREWLLPFDIEGNPRGETDSPGAFTTYEEPASGTNQWVVGGQRSRMFIFPATNVRLL